MLPDLFTGCYVEPNRRFVKKEDGGLMHQSLGEFEPPAHPAGIGPDQVIRPVREFHDRKDFVRFVLRVGDAVEVSKQEHVFPPGELDVNCHVLRDIAAAAYALFLLPAQHRSRRWSRSPR